MTCTNSSQSPKSELFENYTEALRRVGINLAFCPGQPCLSPEEVAVIENLGPDVAKIIKELLPGWSTEVVTMLSVIPLNKEACQYPNSWRLINDYSKKFKNLWQQKFEIMPCNHTASTVPATAELDPRNGEVPAIAILSTGAAAKLFFCIMLVNRLIVIDQFRIQWHKATGVARIMPEDLPGDAAECLICYEKFGVPDENGYEDAPVQTIACCYRYFGEACLRRWYGDKESPNKDCPLCREPVTRRVLYALGLRDEDEVGREAEFTEEEEEGFTDEEEEEVKEEEEVENHDTYRSITLSFLPDRL
jgi:Ring finger domain